MILILLNKLWTKLIGRNKMKADPNEKRLVKQNDLKKLKKEILKEDRKEDNKLYVRKTAKRKK